MRLADNNLMQRDLKKKYQKRGLAKTAWLIIDLIVVFRKLLGIANDFKVVLLILEGYNNG